MAIASEIRRSEAGTLDRVFAIVYMIKDRITGYAKYRSTLNELEALSTRELDDLGINRTMIRDIARDAAYGTDI